ncbi:MAG: helix-turn-helix transcriptional regulator [Ilumatobacter sp.]
MRSSGETVRELRAASGLTKSGFAKLARTSRSAIDEYEAESRSPTVETLSRLAGNAGYRLDLVMSPTRAPGADADRAVNKHRVDEHGVDEHGVDLAGFVDLVDPDDVLWTWRLLVSDFLANQFVPARSVRRQELLAREPHTAGSPHYDALFAAVAEHAAIRAGVRAPSWLAGDRFVGGPPVWFPVHGDLPSTRAASMAHTPAAFRRRCIYVDGRDLPRITP